MNAVWIKSSLSFANGNCVEVAELPGGEIGVRNSRDCAGPVLRFTPDEWDAFLGGARLGEFDRSAATGGMRSGQLGLAADDRRSGHPADGAGAAAPEHVDVARR